MDLAVGRVPKRSVLETNALYDGTRLTARATRTAMVRRDEVGNGRSSMSCKYVMHSLFV